MNKIFITGATGFIGSHLTELCVEKGYEVVAFDRYNPNYNLGWLEKSKYITSMLMVLQSLMERTMLSVKVTILEVHDRWIKKPCCLLSRV